MAVLTLALPPVPPAACGRVRPGTVIVARGRYPLPAAARAASLITPALLAAVADVLSTHGFPPTTGDRAMHRLRHALIGFASGSGREARFLPPAAVEDSRLSLGLLVDVVAALGRHGLPSMTSHWDLSRLMEAIGRFAHDDRPDARSRPARPDED